MDHYLKKPSTTAHVVPTAQVAVIGSNGNLLFLKIVVGANFLTDAAPWTIGSRLKTHRQVMGALPNPPPRSSGNVIDMASIRSLINESQRRGMSSLKTNLSVQ